MQNNDVEYLSDIKHVLLRPSVYIGSVEYTKQEGFFLNKNGKIEYTEYESIGGLLKIINEIIDNSIDEGTRTDFKFSNEITIDITKKTVKVVDNGRGIPITKVQINHEETSKNPNIEPVYEWSPVLAFTHPRAGSNFNDDERDGIGVNGLGAFLTNCYSNVFKVTTCDGKQKLAINCKDNLDTSVVKITKGRKKGTEVYFEPDLTRFGVTEIDDLHIRIIKERLTHIAVSYPQIKFTFNGKGIRVKMAKTYLQAFSEDYEYVEDDNYIIGVMPNSLDDFKHLSHVNGLNICNGGNHVDLFITEIVKRIKNKYIKKYPNMKPGDIKNKLQIVSVFKKFKKAKFEGQTKERLTNSIPSIRTFLGDIDWDKFGTAILKNEKIIDPIIETYKIKEEYRTRKEAHDENSKLLKEKVRLDKYFPSTGKNKYLFLCEGDSAFSGISPILGREEIAYYAMKGVPPNSYEVTTNKILSNNEFKGIIRILGMKITEEVTDCKFDYIVLANDQDVDGSHIQGLMLGFFNKIAPKLIESGRLLRFRSPLITMVKGNKIVEHFFNFSDYKNFIETKSTRGMEVKYYKGLGTWEPKDLKNLIKQFGFDYFLEQFEYDTSANDYIHNWLSKKTSDLRKDYIKETQLDLLKV